MDNAQSEIRHEIESTRAGMVEKIATLEERLQCAIEDVKRSFDLRYQTRKRPWAMTGLSLAAGYLVGRVVFGAAPRRSQIIVRDSAPERRQAASFAQTLSGMLSGVVTAVGVSLAREFATNLLMKRRGRDEGGEDRPGQQYDHGPFH